LQTAVGAIRRSFCFENRGLHLTATPLLRFVQVNCAFYHLSFTQSNIIWRLQRGQAPLSPPDAMYWQRRHPKTESSASLLADSRQPKRTGNGMVTSSTAAIRKSVADPAHSPPRAGAVLKTVAGEVRCASP
jgi:hypothetical protein